jgi:hypothetical protein
MTVGLSLVGTGKNPDGRPDTDFYSTPAWATEALLSRETFEGRILEPACGDGAMSKVLEPYYNIHSFDKYDLGYGERQDFLTYGEEYWNAVITNPPYRHAQEFLERALFLTKPHRGKVALLLKLQFLEGQKRAKILKDSPLKTVYVFSKRLTFYRNNIPMQNGGMMAFAWYVWDWTHEGPPTLDWI